MVKRTDLQTPTTIFSELPTVFRPERATGLNLIFHFDVTGNGGGQWQVTVANNECKVSTQLTGTPHVIFQLSVSDMVALAHRTLAPQAAVMLGRVKVKGDVFTAMRFGQLFEF